MCIYFQNFIGIKKNAMAHKFKENKNKFKIHKMHFYFTLGNFLTRQSPTDFASYWFWSRTHSWKSACLTAQNIPFHPNLPHTLEVCWAFTNWPQGFFLICPSIWPRSHQTNHRLWPNGSNCQHLFDLAFNRREAKGFPSKFRHVKIDWQDGGCQRAKNI